MSFTVDPCDLSSYSEPLPTLTGAVKFVEGLDKAGLARALRGSIRGGLAPATYAYLKRRMLRVVCYHTLDEPDVKGRIVQVSLTLQRDPYIALRSDSVADSPKRLTAITLLSDAYTGGDLALHTVRNEAGAPVCFHVNAGTTVLFPSDKRFQYEVLPVTSGERLALVGWYNLV